MKYECEIFDLILATLGVEAFENITDIEIKLFYCKNHNKLYIFYRQNKNDETKMTLFR